MNKSASVSLLIACVVGGSALWTVANRPCEPVAQAAEQAVLEVPTITIVGEYVPEVAVESASKVAHPSHHPVAHPSHKTCDPFTSSTAACHEQDLIQGTGSVIVCDCQ